MIERKRLKLSYLQYMTLPLGTELAMETFDWLSLAAEFVRLNQNIPDQVMFHALDQANQGVPKGWHSFLEPYHGRLRVWMVQDGTKRSILED